MVNNTKCSGCHACVNICLRKCITMQSDKDGFWYPQINENECTHCKMCEKHCPILNPAVKSDVDPSNAYAAYNKNLDIRLNSSSGGLFTIFAEYIINQGGVVFGAAYDDEFNVVHKCVETVDELQQLRSSKYVQSSIGSTYRQAKELLDAGGLVLFTGTPCQIGGLLAYLRRDYDNLFTQDLICHGVPSPKVWKKYVEFREKKAASKTQRTFSRHKKYGWKMYSVQFEFSNCTEYLKILGEDLYMRGFLADLFLRPSCHNCSFKTLHRQSNITLADFWGIESVLPDMDDDKGISLLIIHSQKGKKLFENTKENIIYHPVDLLAAIKYNPAMIKSAGINPKRNAFLNEIDNMEFDEVIKKYCKVSVYLKFKRSVYRILSKIKRTIIVIMKGQT